MKIYLYYEEQIVIFNLPEVISGSYSFDVDEEEVSKLINVDSKDNHWVLFETDDCKIAQDNSYVAEIPLEVNHFYVLTRYQKNYLIYVSASDERCISAYSYQEQFNLCVGMENATMQYNCIYTNKTSFSISLGENKKIILDIQSGRIYVNKMLTNAKKLFLKNGDEVDIFGAKFIFLNNLIIIVADQSILGVNESLAGIRSTQIHSVDKIENIEVKKDKNLYEEEDYFSKSPRLRRMIEEKKIELTQPPTMETGGEIPFLLTMGPMFTMGISSLMMLAAPISKLSTGESDFSEVGSSLVIGLTMLISTLMFPIFSKIYNTRVKKRNLKKTKEKYTQYINEKELELSNESKLQQEIIKENVISLEQCIDNLKHRKLNFWDKRVDQNDFLVARIGVGNEKLKVDINYPEEGFTLEENELKTQVEELVKKYEYIPDVPIGYSFYENIITAVMGDDKKMHPFVHNILFQLLTFYSYDDLKIVVFTNKKNKQEWDYVKYLNHNMTNDNTFRFFASNEDNAMIVCDALMQEVANRLQILEGNGGDRLFKPYYLIIIDDLDTVKKTNFVERVTELKRNIGFSFIILETKLSKLPSLCNNFINLGEKSSGILKNSYEKQEQVLFQDNINNNINMMEVSKILANIPIEMSGGDEEEANLPDSITFLEMVKVGKVEQLNIMNRWNTNDSTSNLKAEVGVAPDGKLMYLDLHERAHGPHGLIAGMTGSGKSEFIITWILSLSMNFSPEDVSFILIDYKGGGLAFAFENKAANIRLPHLAGTITNLDKAEINRTLVSIDSEVKRRQNLFNEARDALGESTIDIYKYQGYYHEGKLKEPLPHLFIVCDEFAELKAQQPDFMDNLISVARIGRSLGVHLILATQKPSGVVNDQIWSNTKFRVCLKVQDASDSNEMLKKPDAASLKQTGRFYLQVGYDEYFALGQSGWAGAKYYPSDILVKSVDKSVNILDETGIVLKNIQSGNSKAKQVEADGEQLAAIMKEIIKVSGECGKYSRKLWLDNIPSDITIDMIEEKYKFKYEPGKYDVILGECDAPEKQQQYPLIYNFIENGSTNIVGTDSQEAEEIMNTLLFNVVKHFTPEQISYYIIDYGSQNLLKHRKSPNCGGVVAPGDIEEYNNLWKLLSQEKKERRRKLAEFGGEYLDYVNAHPNDMPIMLVIMNNYESIIESDSQFYDFFGEYLRDSSRYGIIYMISYSTINALPDKFRQHLSFTLAMKLKEAGDYGFIFNNVHKKIEPRNIFGRGISKDDSLHEFQTAFICKDMMEENDILLKAFEEANKKYQSKAEKIPSLPEQVLFEDISKKLKGTNKIPVGIEKGTLTVKSLDLTVEIGKIVLGSKLKNTFSFVCSLIDEVMALKCNLIIIDPLKLLDSISNKTNNYFADDLDNKLTLIENFIKQKKDRENVIIINSIKGLNNKLDDKNHIANIVEACKENGNSHIIFVEEAKKMKEFIYEEWYKSIDVSEGIYIGLGVSDQAILKINNFNKELNEKLPNNYGYYISEGLYNIIKLIEFVRVEEDEDDEE